MTYCEWGFEQNWHLHKRGFGIYCLKRGENIMEYPVFKRKIYNEILEWKENRSDKYALLIKGARRVGKSTIVEEFARIVF